MDTLKNLCALTSYIWVHLNKKETSHSKRQLVTSAKYHIVIFQKSVKGFLLISTQMWDFAIVLEFLLDILLLLLLANTQAFFNVSVPNYRSWIIFLIRTKVKASDFYLQYLLWQKQTNKKVWRICTLKLVALSSYHLDASLFLLSLKMILVIITP